VVFAKSSGAILTSQGGGPAALRKGSKIGMPDNFNSQDTEQVLAEESFGNFANVINRFLGVRFLIDGQVHYGWIGFRSVSPGPTAKLAGWAYETEPNKPIAAGDRGEAADSASVPSAAPTSLQLLAMGHTGIADRQRRIAGNI